MTKRRFNVLYVLSYLCMCMSAYLLGLCMFPYGTIGTVVAIALSFLFATVLFRRWEKTREHYELAGWESD